MPRQSKKSARDTSTAIRLPVNYLEFLRGAISTAIASLMDASKLLDYEINEAASRNLIGMLDLVSLRIALTGTKEATSGRQGMNGTPGKVA